MNKNVKIMLRTGLKSMIATCVVISVYNSIKRDVCDGVIDRIASELIRQSDEED